MDTAKQVDDEAFITWPLPSPTSSLGINLRFYSIDEGEEVGARYRVDIGVDTEAMLERMYNDFNLWGRGITTQQFEETTRGLFQQRIAFANAYGIGTALYVAITTDPSEMSRLTTREQRVLASQRRRLPYMSYPQYQQSKPPSIRGRVRWFFGNLRARLFH